MKNKLATSKKIVIASVLIGIFVVAAIVSIVLVLAATQQTVTSNIQVSYVVDGVSAKVSATYATVPNSGTVTKTAMIGDADETELEFEMSDEATTEENPVQLNPGEVELNSTTKKIVYEYKFTNLATSAFTITLIEDIESTNMKVRYKVSKTALSGAAYQTDFTDTTLLSQAMVEKDRDLYIYVSVEVADLNDPASYNGEFMWVLLKNDNLATVAIDNNGGSGAESMTVLTGENIAYPMVYNMPTNGSKLFYGYYSAANDGDVIINPDGTSSIAVGTTAPSTIYARYGEDTVLMNELEVIGLTDAGKAAGTAIIPSSATSIGDSAFENETSLTNVTFAGGETLAYADTTTLTTIGTNAFKGCTGLTELIIPEGVTNIGAGALSGCSSLESLTIPFVGKENGSSDSGDFYEYTIGYIFGENQFNNSKAIITENSNGVGNEKTFYIPKSLTTIKVTKQIYLSAGAFVGCSNLNIFLPDCLKTFAYYGSFFRNSDINLYLTSQYAICNSSYTVPFSPLAIDGVTVYYNGEVLTDIVVPDGITSIGVYAFSGCSSLTSVTFGENSQLKSLGNYAFSGCSLTSIEISSSVTSIGESAFSGCSSLNYNEYDNAYYLGNSENPYLALIDAKNTSITNCEINEKTKVIADSAFSGCTSLTSIEIPNSITSIGNYAFNGCSRLNYYYDNAYYLGNSENPYHALIKAKNTSITSCEINENTKVIADSAFYNCTSLTSIEIPSSVTSIGEYAFYYCSNLNSVTFDENSQLTNIGGSAFYYCSNLTSIEIPSSVTSIGSSAFSSCYNLVQVRNLSEVDYDLYSNGIPSYAEVLTNNTEFNSVIEIGSKYAIFTNGTEKVLLCATDKTITTATDLPSDLTQINQYAFNNCSKLTSIEIPSSVTSIGRSAFWGCSSLTSIEIPSSVTSIGEYAFCYCSNLNSVTFDENSQLINIGGSAFNNCSKLTSIEIPSGVTSIGCYAFYNCSSLTSVTFKNTTGWWWWYSSSSTATSGTSLSSSSLATPSTAATYLTSTYCYYYWKCTV